MSETGIGRGSAILHDVIIRGIFCYLKLSELKVCRQVCSKWRGLSHPFLQQRRFRFKFIASTEEEMHLDEKETEKINVFLRNFENIPPVKFTFKSSIINGHVNILIDILDKNKNNLKFVTIDALELWGSLKPGELWDISKAVFAGDFTSLSISGRHISISMSSMSSISLIDMEYCTILLPSERIPFAAKKLNWSHINFCKDGKVPQKIELDDFLQLQNLKHLEISPGFNTIEKTLISLNMVSRLSLDTLSLDIHWDDMDTNWPFLNLTIRKFILWQNKTHSSAIPNGVQLQKLILCSSGNNINFIPQTLKKLILRSGRTMWQRDENYHPRLLHNLNYLQITSLCNLSFLEHFGDVIPNLSQLYVKNYDHEIMQLKAAFIPPNVKQIKLFGKVQFCGDNRIIPLHSIILTDYQLEYFDDLFKYCRPKLCVILSSVSNYINDYVDKAKILLEENKCERVVIGEFLPGNRWNAITSKHDAPGRNTSKYRIHEKTKTCPINLEDLLQLMKF